MSRDPEMDNAMELFEAARRYSRSGTVEDARAVCALIGKRELSDPEQHEWAGTIWAAYVDNGIAAKVEALSKPELTIN